MPTICDSSGAGTTDISVCEPSALQSQAPEPFSAIAQSLPIGSKIRPATVSPFEITLIITPKSGRPEAKL
ncbi:hypothetical protein D3C86_1685030 [compost metagenome]